MSEPSEEVERASVHEEAERWVRGDQEANYYEQFLERSAENPLAQHGNGSLNKILKPEDMPWELSPQGLLKHMLNEDLAERYNFPGKGADMYMQVVPSDSKSGKHRHMGEEILIVLEGEGYDLHWDADLNDPEDVPEFTYADEPKRFDWQAGDAVYIPANTIHQHFNDGNGPARFISAQARAYTNLGYGYEDLEQFEIAPEYSGDTDSDD
jgi:quercetin dioxygenase-like cupin family protein